MNGAFSSVIKVELWDMTIIPSSLMMIPYLCTCEKNPGSKEPQLDLIPGGEEVEVILT